MLLPRVEERKLISHIPAIILIAFIRLYRLVRPGWIVCCRYYPSCSLYAWQAIVVYGPWRGVLMAGRRILRCHPLNLGGMDPV